jgi:NADH-quinone oxidoreductase subunit F
MACGMCRKQCPADAIDGDKKIIHIIDQDKCTRCGTCFEVCPAKFGAVTKLSGEPVPQAIEEEKRKIKQKTKKDAGQNE